MECKFLDFTSFDGNREVVILHERILSVVVPGVHENVTSVQGVQIALFVPRTLQELDSTKLHKIVQNLRITTFRSIATSIKPLIIFV